MDDDVLAAALAFLDEQYDGSDNSASTRSSSTVRYERWKKRRRNETEELRRVAQELERFLADRQARVDAKCLPWASIAESRRVQRTAAVMDNARLRDIVTERTAVARRLVRISETRCKDQKLLGHSQRTPRPRRVPVLDDAVLFGVLQQALDQVIAGAQHTDRSPSPPRIASAMPGSATFREWGWCRC